MIWLELAFLSKVIYECDLDTPLRLGITADTLLDHNNRKVLRTLAGYHGAPATRGMTPTIDYIVGKYPSFSPVNEKDIPQKLPALCHELRERKLAAMVSRLCTDTLRNIHGDPQRTFNTLRQSVVNYQAQFTESYDMSLSTNYEWLAGEYDKREKAGGVTGIEWPWPSLTEDTGGINNKDFIVFYGRQKTMKSWSVLYVGAHAYLTEKKRVLVFTWEMPREQLLYRAASIMAAADYTDWKKGGLPEKTKAEAFKRLRYLRSMERTASEKGDKSAEFVVTTTRSNDGGPGGVNSVRQKIEERRPDLVIVDGVYNMSDDKKGGRSFKHDSQAEIVLDLNSLGKEYGVPVIVSTQANRHGEDIEDDGSRDAAFTDKINMYCDLMIKNHHMKEDGKHCIYSRIRLARECELSGIKIHAHVGEHMTEVTKFSSDAEFVAALKKSKELEKERAEGNGSNIDQVRSKYRESWKSKT